MSTESSKSHKGVALRIAGVLALGLAAASCMTVAESVLIYDTPPAPGTSEFACHTRLGGYFLPKSFLRVQIDKQSSSSLAKTDFVLRDVTTVVQPDNRRAYCLDYLASSFADDLVTVTRSNSTADTSKQLLQTVSSSAVDQTAIIIRTIIRTAFTAISSSLRSATISSDAVTETVADLTFDPFNQAQTAVINDRVRHFGFCFVLEAFTLGVPTRDAVQAYCRNPTRILTMPTWFAAQYAAYETTQIPPRTEGIFYRPRATYELSIYAKDDPEGPGPWLPRRTIPVGLENISPVIAVGLDRAAFTEKQIALGFVQGDLAQVCIYKKSEMVQVVQIPLEIVKSIVALPTQAFQIQYDQITQSQALVAAENNILQSQAKLLALQQSPATAANPGGPAGAPALPTAPPNPVSPIPGKLEALKRTGTGDYKSCKGLNSSQAASPAKAS